MRSSRATALAVAVFGAGWLVGRLRDGPDPGPVPPAAPAQACDEETNPVEESDRVRVEEIAVEARTVSAWRALVLYPLVVIPGTVLRLAVRGVARICVRGFGMVRARDTTAQPRQPLSAPFLLVAVTLAMVTVAVINVNTNRDRLTAVGLLAVAAATVAAAPELMSPSTLRRLDDAWFKSRFPVYQLAFARHGRRLVAFLLRLGLSGIVADVVLTGALVLANRLAPGATTTRLTDPGVSPVAWSFVAFVLVVVASSFIRLLIGVDRHTDAIAPVTVDETARLLRDPEAQQQLFKVAGALFAAGTLLQLIAVLFL